MKYYIFENDNSLKLPVGKIICLARTYKKHAKEMGSSISSSPLVFLKPASSVIFSDESIRVPPLSNCIHHEVEMGIVIGKTGKDIKIEEADDFILGFNVSLDITARDIQDEAKKKGLPWTIAKGFDTFAPISTVVFKEAIVDPQNVNIELRVNDVVKQRSNTRFMVWSIKELISFISSIMTLEKGDLILTGTPEGVGEIKKGDLLKASLDEYCSLEVNVL